MSQSVLKQNVSGQWVPVVVGAQGSTGPIGASGPVGPVHIFTGFDGGTASTTTFDLTLDLGAAYG